jgi:arginyl-tRNA synthetase
VLLEAALDAAIAHGDLKLPARPPCRVEPPEDAAFGDATSRVAMVIARRLGRPAPEVAGAIARHVTDPDGWLDGMDARGPGFVNLRASLALWRAALAARLRDRPEPRAVERAVVLSAVPAGHPAAPRAEMVADALGRLLAAAGLRVERLAGPLDVLATHDAAGDVARAVAVVAPGARHAARQAKAAFAAAGGRAGRLTALAVAPTEVRRRGRVLEGDEAAVVLARPSARFLVAATPVATPVLVPAERTEGDRIDDALVSIRYALARIARLPGPPAVPVLDALGEGERECLRGVGTYPDVVSVAARRLEPDAVAAHAVALAAAFHRYYNRGRFVGGDATTASSRGALGAGIARVLEAAVGLVVGAARERE